MSPWARMQCTKLTCRDDWLAGAKSKIPAIYGRIDVEIPPPRISRLRKTPGHGFKDSISVRKDSRQ